jgi:hypothetical protein
MDTSKYRPLAYLLGSKTTYSAADAVGSPANRNMYRHHTFQRIVKDEGGGNPAVKIQARIIPVEDAVDAAEWSTIATLNNSTPIAFFGHTLLPAVRAVRDDGSTVEIKVLVFSGNDRDDEG